MADARGFLFRGIGRVIRWSIGCGIGLAAASAWAQTTATFETPLSLSKPGGRSYLGLNIGRGQLDTSCAATALVCENKDRPATLYAGTMFSSHWGAEFAYVDTGPFWRGAAESRAQGLNLSVVGRYRVAPSLGVFGKLGTTYGRTDTSMMGNAAASGPDQGFGLSFGGGVSYEITPRLSATLEWDSRELRFANGREPVRSTSLGLQWRY
jgi:opacity protein-like surface antigen